MPINHQQIAEELWKTSKSAESISQLATQFETKYPNMTNEDFVKVNQYLDALILEELKSLIGDSQ